MSRELKMTKEEFWHLIDEMRAACGTDMAKEEHWIVERLKTMGSEQIIGFQCIFLSYHDAADKYGLWPVWRGHGCIPRSENLARLMKSMLLEQLRSCHLLREGMETKTKKCVRNPNGWQEVRHSHSIEEVCESRWRKGLCTL